MLLVSPHQTEGIARHDDPFDDAGDAILPIVGPDRQVAPAPELIVWPLTGVLRVQERAANPGSPVTAFRRPRLRTLSVVCTPTSCCGDVPPDHDIPGPQIWIDGPGCSCEQNSLRPELIDEKRRDDSRVDFAGARTPHDDRLAVQMSDAEQVTAGPETSRLSSRPPFDRVYLACDAEDADDRLSDRLPRKEKEQGSDANRAARKCALTSASSHVSSGPTSSSTSGYPQGKRTPSIDAPARSSAATESGSRRSVQVRVDARAYGKSERRPVFSVLRIDGRSASDKQLHSGVPRSPSGQVKRRACFRNVPVAIALGKSSAYRHARVKRPPNSLDVAVACELREQLAAFEVAHARDPVLRPQSREQSRRRFARKPQSTARHPAVRSQRPAARTVRAHPASPSCGERDRRPAVRCGQCWISTVVQEYFNVLEGIVATDGLMEGSQTPRRHVIGVGAVLEQKRDPLMMMPIRFPKQHRRKAVRCKPSAIDECLDHTKLEAFRRVIDDLTVVGVRTALKQEPRQIDVMCHTGRPVKRALPFGRRLVVHVEKPCRRARARIEEGPRGVKESR